MKQVLVGLSTLFLPTLVHAQSALDLLNLEVEVPSVGDASFDGRRDALVLWWTRCLRLGLLASIKCHIMKVWP